MIFFEILGIYVAIIVAEIIVSMLTLIMSDEDSDMAMVGVIMINSFILAIIAGYAIL